MRLLYFNMSVQTQEARIIMAMEAIQSSNRKISCRKAVKIYNVPEPTLRARMTGRQPISSY